MSLRLFAFALAVVSVACSQESTSKPLGAERMVSMRDGVELATVVYLPEGKGPWPAVLKRTPYGKDLSTSFEDDGVEVVAPSSLVFEKGHRMARHITSSNFPRSDINPNTGEPPGGPTADTRIATHSVYQDATGPPALLLPIAEITD